MEQEEEAKLQEEEVEDEEEVEVDDEEGEAGENKLTFTEDINDKVIAKKNEIEKQNPNNRSIQWSKFPFLGFCRAAFGVYLRAIHNIKSANFKKVPDIKNNQKIAKYGFFHDPIIILLLSKSTDWYQTQKRMGVSKDEMLGMIYKQICEPLEAVLSKKQQDNKKKATQETYEEMDSKKRNDYYSSLAIATFSLDPDISSACQSEVLECLGCSRIEFFCALFLHSCTEEHPLEMCFNDIFETLILRKRVYQNGSDSFLVNYILKQFPNEDSENKTMLLSYLVLTTPNKYTRMISDVEDHNASFWGTELSDDDEESGVTPKATKRRRKNGGATTTRKKKAKRTQLPSTSPANDMPVVENDDNEDVPMDANDEGEDVPTTAPANDIQAAENDDDDDNISMDADGGGEDVPMDVEEDPVTNVPLLEETGHTKRRMSPRIKERHLRRINSSPQTGNNRVSSSRMNVGNTPNFSAVLDTIQTWSPIPTTNNNNNNKEFIESIVKQIMEPILKEKDDEIQRLRSKIEKYEQQQQQPLQHQQQAPSTKNDKMKNKVKEQFPVEKYKHMPVTGNCATGTMTDYLFFTVEDVKTLSKLITRVENNIEFSLNMLRRILCNSRSLASLYTRTTLTLHILMFVFIKKGVVCIKNKHVVVKNGQSFEDLLPEQNKTLTPLKYCIEKYYTTSSKLEDKHAVEWVLKVIQKCEECFKNNGFFEKSRGRTKTPTHRLKDVLQRGPRPSAENEYDGAVGSGEDGNEEEVESGKDENGNEEEKVESGEDEAVESAEENDGAVGSGEDGNEEEVESGEDDNEDEEKAESSGENDEAVKSGEEENDEAEGEENDEAEREENDEAEGEEDGDGEVEGGEKNGNGDEIIDPESTQEKSQEVDEIIDPESTQENTQEV